MKKTVNRGLRQLMRRHRLTIKEVADRLHVSQGTVKSWRRREGLSGYRNMPQAHLDLLKSIMANVPNISRLRIAPENRGNCFIRFLVSVHFEWVFEFGLCLRLD